MSAGHLTPADRMVLKAVRCIKCGAGYGQCACWEEPTAAVHEAIAREAAAAVISYMRTMYPEPMRHASGGFRKTLHATVIREVRKACQDALR